MLRQLHAGALLEGIKFRILIRVFVLQRSIRFRDDRSMPGRADGDLHRVTADDLDGFRAGFKIHPFAIDFILIWVFRINSFDIQIHHIRTDIREAPGDPVIMTDDNTRHTREGEAGYVVRTFLGYGLAVAGEPGTRSMAFECRDADRSPAAACRSLCVDRKPPRSWNQSHRLPDPCARSRREMLCCESAARVSSGMSKAVCGSAMRLVGRGLRYPSC